MPYIFASIALAISITAFLTESFMLKEIKFEKSHLVFSSLIMMFIANMLYFGFDSKVLEKLLRIVPILFFPILFFNVQLNSKELNRILDFFLGSLIMFCVFSIGYVSINYWLTETREHLLTLEKTILVGQVYISRVFEFHTPYLSFYLLTGCIICYHKAFRQKKYIYMFCLLLVFMLYFTGRTSLFLALLLFVLLLKSFFKSTKKAVILLTCIVFFIGYACYNFPMLNEKTMRVFEKGFGVYQRYYYLEAAFIAVKENIILGLGLVNYQVELSKFLPNGVIANTHNQYLEFFVSTGLFGLVTYLYLKFEILKKAIVQRPRTLLIFIIFFSLAELTEALLYRQRGIMLFAFITSLLFYSNLTEKKVYSYRNNV